MLIYLLLGLCVGIIGCLIAWLIYECIDIYYKCGTVGYRAPEQDDYRMCYLSDIYSMGITIIELWNGDIWINKDDFKGCRSEALSGLRKIEKNHTQFGKLLRRAISLHPNVLRIRC